MALTLDEFVSVARESKLLKPDLLDSMLGEVKTTGSIHDSHALASRLVGHGALTHWQSEKLLGGVSSGFFLGKYKLQRLIASGSMSSVYEAEHTLLRKRFALKVLPKALVDEASFLERFYREARAVVQLDHPNIIRGFDVGQDGDYHYFVMEYLEGSSFQDLIEKYGPVSPDVAAGMIKQAANGLQHAHQAGMIHRDIKPANLLLAEDGVVKVLDLGLVRSSRQENDGEAGLTRVHDERMLGTVDYLSPEQAIDSHTVDIRSDIYSLGCTFYFLLAGDPPFAKGTLTERLLAHQTRSAIPISVIRPDVPASLGRILSRMLEKRPDARYQAPAEIAMALDEWLNQSAEPIPVAAAVSQVDSTKSSWLESTKQGHESGAHSRSGVRSSSIAASATRVSSSASSLLSHSSILSASSTQSLSITSRSPSLFTQEPVAAKSQSAVVTSQSTVATWRNSLGPEPETPPVVRRNLWEPWALWVRAVESLGSNAPLRMTPGDDVYREIYEALIQACRDLPEETTEGTRKLAREIRDTAAPWMNVQSIRSILQSEMRMSVLSRIRQLDKVVVAAREDGGVPKKSGPSLGKIFLLMVAASLIGAAALFAGPEPSESEISQSWVAQARVNLKRQLYAISDKFASY